MFGHRELTTGAQGAIRRPPEAVVFNRDFCARVRAAREAKRTTQAEMARHLGVTLKAYEKYESRSPLPHRLVAKFVALTGVDIDELFE